MSKLLLSLVIPCYNMEKYLERNLSSFAQVKTEYLSLFELLFVNDGSKDQSLQLARQWQEKMPQLLLRVIDKENGGHGSTINQGLALAKGKYFRVVDADDWVDTEAFEKYLSLLREESADMILTDYTEQYQQTKSFKTIQLFQEREVKRAQGLPPQRLVMHSLTFLTEVLRKAKLSLFEKIFYVDVQYTLFPLPYIKDWAYYPLSVYQYLLGREGQSVSFESLLKNAAHHAMVLESVLKFYAALAPGEAKRKVEERLQELVSAQWVLHHFAPLEQRETLFAQLFEQMQQANFKYTLRFQNKFAALIYLNQKTKGFFSRFFPWIFSALEKKVQQRSVF